MTIPVPGQQGQRFRGKRADLAALGLVFAMIAGFVWCAAATPASAQPKAPEAGAPPASASLANRKQLLIVGSSSLAEMTDAVIKRLIAAFVMPPPTERFTGTKAGLASFCAGIGLEYPDIVAATYRMDGSTFDHCVENGIRDVIEVEIGDSAVVVITKKGDPIFDLTPLMAYTGLAEETPVGGEFKTNQRKSWKEVDKGAPDLPIRVIVPAKGTATRRFFDDDFMEGGCRRVKEVAAIFAAAERVPKCITPRDDGAVTEVKNLGVDEKGMVDALMTAPKGTLAVVGWLTYLDNKDKLDVLPVDGVVPTHESISDDSYEISTTLRYYFKRAHMEGKLGGKDVVEGIPEFMAEIVSNRAAGEGGYLEKLGLVAKEPEELRTQQTIVRRLKRFQP